MTISNTDRDLMGRALELAANGRYSCDPNPCVGSVLVKDGEIVGEGWHEIAGQGHAEVNAIADAGDAAKGATAYVTLEPCCFVGRTGACTDALIKAGVTKVVYAVDDPNPKVAGQGADILRAAGIEVEGDVLSEQARELNKGFWSRMQKGRPLVTAKIAATIDGRTAPADGVSHGEGNWITGDEARQDVQRLRAASSAVVTGIGTVLADDPSMNVRGVESPVTAPVKQPLRVVIDSQLRIPVDAKTLSLAGDVLILTVSDDVARREALEAAGARVVQVAEQDGQVSLSEAMRYLASIEINDVLLEAGAKLNGAFLAAGLIDELVLYQSPKEFGNDGLPMFEANGEQLLSVPPVLHLIDSCQLGGDTRTIYRSN